MLEGLRERASSGHCCHHMVSSGSRVACQPSPRSTFTGLCWAAECFREWEVTQVRRQSVAGPQQLWAEGMSAACHQCYFYSSLWTPWGLSLVKCFSLSEVTTITLIIIYYSSLLHNDTRLMSLTPTMFKYRAWNIKAYENFTVFTQYILFQGKNKYGEQAAFFSIASATFSINDYTNPQANKNNPLFSFWL